MSDRKLSVDSVGRKLTYGSESDRPSKKPEIDINGQNISIKQTKTSGVGNSTANKSLSPSTNDNNQLLLRNDNEQQRPEPRVSAFNLQQPDKLTLGNKIMRGVFGFFGGLIGGAAGAVAGFVGGSIIGTPITGIGAAVVAGGAGLSSGAYNGVALADSISGLFDNAPQDRHLDTAMHSLQSSRGPFSSSEANNLKNVSPREWRNLLPVHRNKPWFGNDKRVGNRADRQKIREAVVLFIAKHGKGEAAAYKDRLIAAANSRTPHALQSEINKLKAPDVARELGVVSDMDAHNRDATAEAFGKVVRDNPDVFLAPSAVQQTQNFKMNAQKIGMQAALGVVDRMERTGRITEQDRREFNRAMNILGLPDRTAHADPKATKDVLGPYVGKYLNHESKHKIAQALYKQFGIDDQQYSLNLYTEPRRVLQSTLDPAQFNKDLDDSKMAKATYGKYANQPSYDTAAPSEREAIARAELAALRAAAKDSLVADAMAQQTARQIHDSLNEVANGFETPSEQTQRLQQQRVQQAKSQKAEPNGKLNELKALRDRYVPGGDRFDAIANKLGLRSNEYNKEQLVRSINVYLMQEFGKNGENIGQNASENLAGANSALLRAVAGHMGTQTFASQPLVSSKRAEELQKLANDWGKNGIPGQLALDQPIDVQGQATDRFAEDVQTIANKNFGNYVPEPRDDNKLVPFSQADKPGDLTQPEKFDDGVHEQFLADIDRRMTINIDGRKIPNDQKGAKQALQSLDEESRKTLTAFLHQGLPQAIGKALGDPNERSPDAFFPGLPSDADHHDNHVVFDVTTNDDGSFDVNVDYKQHINTALPTEPKAPTLYDPDGSFVAYQFNVKIDPKAMNPMRITSPINYEIKTKLQE